MSFHAFPSRNKFPFCTLQDWLTEKAQADQERTGYLPIYKQPKSLNPKYWYLDGKQYDLTSFIYIHPGGKDFLKMTQGQDITELYHTYHLNEEKVSCILSQYLIDVKPHQKNENKVISLYSFDPSGFYMTLKAKINKHLTKGKGPTPLMRLTTKFVLVIFLISILITSIMGSYMMAFLTGLILHIIYGLGHNYMHQNTKYKYLFDLTFMSHYHWMISHCISHHNYPNTKIDLELSLMEPYFYFLRSGPANNKFVFIYSFVLFGFIGFLEFVQKFVAVILGKENMRLEYLLPILEWVVLSSGGFKQGFYLLMTMQFVASLLLMITSFPVHRNKFAYSDGSDQKPERDFGIYTLQTTMDYNLNIPFPINLILFEGFNDHVLHHLFPSIDISRLSELHYYLDQSLQEYGLQRKYKKFKFQELFSSLIKLLNRKVKDISQDPIY